LVTLLVLTMIIGDWLVAGNAARRLIRERLTSTAQVASDSLPYFIETGQNLILTLAGPELLNLSTEELPGVLASRLRTVPYFRQLFLFDLQGQTISGYPVADLQQVKPTLEELSGIGLALKGVTAQTYIIPPVSGETSAQVSFIAAIRDAQGQVVGVLLGRTDFNTNPFTQPAIRALLGIAEIGGEGMILSEEGLVLYHPVVSQLMSAYTGDRPTTPLFYDEISPENTRRYVYYQPVVGRPWAVVLTVPAQYAQQVALDIAVPLLAMLIVFSVIAFIFLRLILHAVTSSLQVLAEEASFISKGQLDRPLAGHGVDEVGRLSATFEQMRVSLKARLDELNRLLYVSHGVAANLDINEAVRPILEAAILNGASAARVVLMRDVTLDPSDGGPIAFGVGPASQVYSGLDLQLFELARNQDVVNLPNVSRTRRLQLEPGRPHPGGLLALAIRYENRYFGVVWVGYERARGFTEEEVRFLSTLAGQAALAASSARLYANAEVGRQRLEAVLASTPEPVLVIDEKACLLLLNPAAVQVPGLITSPVEGRPIRDVMGPQEVIDLLMVPLTERISSREVTLPNNKVYYASVSAVMAEGRSVGRVCILRDITHFKELEQLKSDFVATVSHDLRSPLTLMRGYATMLQMVGDLNDQQKGYVRKIIAGVENMARLVNNLLDLGRIEAGIGLQIEKVMVSEVVEEVINSLQLQAVQKDIRLSPEMNDGAKNITIEADRALVQQAMVNLVENAIKYTPVSGQVKVRIEARPNTILIEVHDTGIGIAPIDSPHLFEKFYRSGRREAYQQRGTGLGLAIVKSIADRHGGRVWVDSQLGKGSVFSLEIPCEQVVQVQIVKK
jgi:PAS domain S-box-containing protein